MKIRTHERKQMYLHYHILLLTKKIIAHDVTFALTSASNSEFHENKLETKTAQDLLVSLPRSLVVPHFTVACKSPAAADVGAGRACSRTLLEEVSLLERMDPVFTACQVELA